jgi:hypothetical protein
MFCVLSIDKGYMATGIVRIHFIARRPTELSFFLFSSRMIATENFAVQGEPFQA